MLMARSKRRGRPSMRLGPQWEWEQLDVHLMTKLIFVWLNRAKFLRGFY